MSDRDREPLLDALEHPDVMAAHLARGSLDDPLVFDAVCQRLASAIESLSRRRSERRQEVFGDEWHAIWATRNRIAHAYLRINPVTIRATVERNIPQLIDIVRQSLAELRNRPDSPTQDEHQLPGIRYPNSGSQSELAAESSWSLPRFRRTPRAVGPGLMNGCPNCRGLAFRAFACLTSGDQWVLARPASALVAAFVRGRSKPRFAAATLPDR